MSHVIHVGYQKGAEEIRESFTFSVEAMEYPFYDPNVDHAQEGFDFEIHTEEVQISFGSASPATVEVTFFPDNVALETNEVVNFELVPSRGASFQLREGVFFRKTLEVLITDSDGKFYYSQQLNWRAIRTGSKIFIIM